jgi:hypothetical protein
VSGLKLAGNSRNKSTSFGDSQIDHQKHTSKGSYKYRNLSFYNAHYLEKKSSNNIIPGMVSKYANQIISKPVLLKKNIKSIKTVSKGQNVFENSRTRNPYPGI